jgi:hypothetical protein
VPRFRQNASDELRVGLRRCLGQALLPVYASLCPPLSRTCSCLRSLDGKASAILYPVKLVGWRQIHLHRECSVFSRDHRMCIAQQDMAGYETQLALKYV